MTGLNWTTPPELFADVCERDLDRMYRGFCLTVWNNLTQLSPVDTGRYRANHMISFNSPSYAIDSGTGFIAPPSGSFPTVYIQNNLPYALRIENGWSGQAPTGVYQNAFNSAVASFS